MLSAKKSCGQQQFIHVDTVLMAAWLIQRFKNGWYILTPEITATTERLSMWD